jgi:c-di-GMP-binding flagellar brake protein YcgR
MALKSSAKVNDSSSSVKDSSNKDSSSKNRRWRRVPLDVRVKAIIIEDERETVVHGRSSQLSEGGMGVTMTREIPKGTVATLIFKLPGNEDERTLQAEVKYRRGFRCGFEFREISAQTRKELLHFCMRTAR